MIIKKKNKPNKSEIQATIRFLKQFMNYNRKQQIEIVNNMEKQMNVKFDLENKESEEVEND